ncbi:hypothetical protein NA78x_001639 [Anatilimnocola sp. NA78]
MAALLLIVSGCSEKTPTKTADPGEIEKIRQQHIQTSQREMQGK